MVRQPSIKIHFFSDGIKLNLRNRKNLKLFIADIFKAEKRGLESINFIFCTDKKILEINKKHLKHDFLTDVITFELNLPGRPIISDVYISFERVKENAQLLRTSFSSEIHRVIFHGILHLCGFSDKSKSELLKMRKKEDYYLNNYFKKCFT
jgi:rRNA maturation RNase YbeY